MNAAEFRRFLSKNGRSDCAAARAIALVQEFENFLHKHFSAGLDDAGPAALESFVAHVEEKPQRSAKGHLWAIIYYYQFAADAEMLTLASTLRQDRIQRRPFPLKSFFGIKPDDVVKLTAVGVRDVKQLLKAGATPESRGALAQKTVVAVETIQELVQLSDLARIPGIKGIRARLYLDAGVQSIADLAQRDAAELLATTAAFVAQSHFPGIAPLPAEVEYAVAHAKSLPTIIEL